MYEDMPMRKVGENFEGLLFGDTPLGWPIAGPKDNINRFQRKDFVKFLRRGYVGKNIVVGIAGKVDMKEAEKLVSKIFKEVSAGEKVKCIKAKNSQKEPQVLITHKKTDQTQMVAGVRAYDMEHKDRAALSVLASILGGGMSSRMFMEVRERRGLAYSVHTSADSFTDTGYLATQCGVEHENLEKALQVVMDEYKKIRDIIVGKEELQKAKESIKGRMALGLEGSDDVVEYLVSQEVLKNKIILPKEKVKMIDRVTAADVQRVAKDIFQNKKLNLAIIGPKADKKKLTKILQF
jgi:predicted Zn-dependent peptidase